MTAPNVPGVIGLYANNSGMNNISAQPVDDRMMSALPVVNQPWPPPEYDPIAYDLRVWDAWWTGDRQKLAWTYYNLGANSPVAREYFSSTGEAGLPAPRPGQFRGGLLGSVEYSFWGEPVPPGEKRSRLHVPIAGDIAQTSASLLFAKPPVFRSTLADEKQAAINNAWFEDLVDDHFHARLLEAAEMCAAHGGVFLRVVWDTSVRQHPWIVPVPFDVGIPTFSYDVLKSVIFWKTLADNGSEVIRHLEQHVPGQNAISHGLYRGDQTDLGDRIGLDQHPVTEAIMQGAPTMEGDTIFFPDQPLDASSVVYVPNLTPNRIWRDLGEQAWPLGRSDFSGVEPLMDALDEAYSSWMRDIRLAKMRLIVPSSYLDSIGKGKGAVFEPDRQVYVPMDFLHDDADGPSITANQFVIRWQEHQETCQDLVNRIVQEAGYSPQTFGDYDGNAPTATEITSRERISNSTRSKKINYWRPALQDAIYGLMTIESIYFGNTAITPERPEVEFIETIAPDMQTLAQTASLLEAANAASKQVLVQYVHPDWTPTQVDEEVGRIFAETGAELAARARVTLAPPMGATLQSDVQALAAEVPDKALPASVPGDEPDAASTGEETE